MGEIPLYITGTMHRHAFHGKVVLNSRGGRTPQSMLSTCDVPYRGASLIRKRNHLGPYRRTVCRVLGESY